VDECKGRHGVISGKTVSFMSEHIRDSYDDALYKSAYNHTFNP